MFDVILRNIKENVLIPFVNMIPLSITPNTITCISGVFGLICSYFCAIG